MNLPLMQPSSCRGQFSGLAGKVGLVNGAHSISLHPLAAIVSTREMHHLSRVSSDSYITSLRQVLIFFYLLYVQVPILQKNRSGLKPIVPKHLPDPLSCLEDIFKKVSYEELKAIEEYHIYDQLFAVVVLLWCKVLLQTSALKQHFNVKYLLLPLAQISSCYREMHQQPEPTSVGVGQVRLCYVILLKHDNAVIFRFSRVYSFDQAQNHWDIRYLKGVKL